MSIQLAIAPFDGKSYPMRTGGPKVEIHEIHQTLRNRICVKKFTLQQNPLLWSENYLNPRVSSHTRSQAVAMIADRTASQ